MCQIKIASSQLMKLMGQCLKKSVTLESFQFPSCSKGLHLTLQFQFTRKKMFRCLHWLTYSKSRILRLITVKSWYQSIFRAVATAVSYKVEMPKMLKTQGGPWLVDLQIFGMPMLHTCSWHSPCSIWTPYFCQIVQRQIFHPCFFKKSPDWIQIQLSVFLARSWLAVIFSLSWPPAASF